MNNTVSKKRSLLYLVKEFIFRIFKKHEYEMLNESKEYEYKDSELKDELRKQYSNENRKKELYEMLLSGEIDSSDLTDDEVNDLIVFVKNDINQKNHEIDRIKNKILKIKENLN